MCSVDAAVNLRTKLLTGDHSRASTEHDIMDLWHQSPASDSTLVIKNCDGDGREMSGLSERDDRLPQIAPALLLLRSWRAQRASSTDGGIECSGPHLLTRLDHVVPRAQEAVSWLYGVVAPEAKREDSHTTEALSSTESSHTHHTPGSRSLLSVDGEAVMLDYVGTASEPSDTSTRKRSPNSPTQSTKLPPALPPLPLPLSLLRQHLGSGGAQSPSLPPPLALGKQCIPETSNSCGCQGGQCECDLYPDYSSQRLSLATSSTPSADVSLVDEEKAIVPPLRRLQFFNSEFKSSRHKSNSKPSGSHYRALREKGSDGPSLRVMCFCRCP